MTCTERRGGTPPALPALSLLDEPDIDRAWRLTGGHPRVMEYLVKKYALRCARFCRLLC